MYFRIAKNGTANLVHYSEITMYLQKLKAKAKVKSKKHF